MGQTVRLGQWGPERSNPLPWGRMVRWVRSVLVNRLDRWGHLDHLDLLGQQVPLGQLFRSHQPVPMDRWGRSVQWFRWHPQGRLDPWRLSAPLPQPR